MKVTDLVRARARVQTYGLALVLALAAPLVSCASEPKIVVEAGQPIVVDPKPNDPKYDPRTARVRAAGREIERIAGHPVRLRVEATLLPNVPGAFEDVLVGALVDLARALDYARSEDPEAFRAGTAKLEEVFSRYEPLAREPRARLESGGTRLVVETSARSGQLAPGFAISHAFSDSYDDTVATEMRGRPSPRTDDEIAARFAWLTRTRPGRGSVVVARAVARATGEGREAAHREAAAEVRLEVLALEERAKGAELVAKLRTWLVDELPRVVHAKTESTKLGLAPRDSAVFRADRAYDAFVQKRLWDLPEAEAKKVVEVLFPRGEPCHGAEASCTSGRAPFGISRLDVGMKLLAEARNASWDPAHAAHPELVRLVVCPARRDPRGKPRESCNASFAAHAIATNDGRARLVGELSRAADPVFASEVAATLSYASPDDIRAYLRALEEKPTLYRETVRALVDARIDRARGVLDEEGRRVYRTKDPVLKAATLTVLAETRGSLHPHYADGYFERFETEWGERIDAATLRAFLDGSPRALTSVPRVWKALGPGKRVGPVADALGPFLAAPTDSLAEARSVTLEAIVRRLCDEGAVAELAAFHEALERAKRGYSGAAHDVDNALADSEKGRCKKTDKTENRE
ncbi:MAG: hypothetical protein IPK71_30460 [Myxococcales bacterium]|nr:hypothetical protein [Myxococcales bacterium]